MDPGLTTRSLIAAAGTLWFVDASLAALHVIDSMRSITQGVAITLSVFAGMSWYRDRGARVSTPQDAGYLKTYVSSHALLDVGPITVELPRMAAAISAPPTGAELPSIIMGQLYRLGAADAANRRQRP